MSVSTKEKSDTKNKISIKSSSKRVKRSKDESSGCSLYSEQNVGKNVTTFKDTRRTIGFFI